MLYEIQNFKNVDVEEEDMNKYPFSARGYNPYDSYCLMKYHGMNI